MASELCLEGNRLLEFSKEHGFVDMAFNQEPRKSFLGNDENSARFTEDNQQLYDWLLSTLESKDDCCAEPRFELRKWKAMSMFFGDWQVAE